MYKITFSRNLLILSVALLALAVMGGCFRKHIASSPPAQRPSKRVEVTPAPAPEVVEEKKLEVIEETYVVDAPDQGPAPVKVEEGDLGEEPVVTKADSPAAVPVAVTGEKVPASKIDEPARTSKAAPVEQKATDAVASPEQETAAVETVIDGESAQTTSVLKEMYYVQVGAFSNLENANRALARLISDGYKGSRLVRTDDGLYRAQAGAFPDEVSAGNALEKLHTDYPKGFVLKTD
ncbi:SPOR domain-containing protein [uncultured Pseudodesulfovibrio sp.]|uniref:SPOR domain-containing protein n=1 Tax=uncultured Pseudodesulfovibrio sp. TaxID=2035858 RepID=UPI0029C99604|nr:SPOR domain-containing protein [uncultured Pseudodesulfovibrio sp.]